MSVTFPIILFKSISIATLAVFLLNAYRNRNIKAGEGIVLEVEPNFVPLPIAILGKSILVLCEGKREEQLVGYFIRFIMGGEVFLTYNKVSFKKGEKIKVVYEEKKHSRELVTRTILSISKIEKK